MFLEHFQSGHLLLVYVYIIFHFSPKNRYAARLEHSYLVVHMPNAWVGDDDATLDDNKRKRSRETGGVRGSAKKVKRASISDSL